MGEAGFVAIICSLMLGGVPEQKQPYLGGYTVLGEPKHTHVRTDCATDTHVIEIGLDKRSSLDSLQQAHFAAILTGKLPKIIIVDTDGRVGRWETRIRATAQATGVAFERMSDDALIRFQMTQWMRNYDRATASPKTHTIASVAGLGQSG